MLTIGLLSLIAALTSGVFGFRIDALPGWTLGKVAFVVFLMLAAGAYISSELRRPSLLWAVVDDMKVAANRRRYMRWFQIRIGRLLRPRVATGHSGRVAQRQ